MRESAAITIAASGDGSARFRRSQFNDWASVNKPTNISIMATPVLSDSLTDGIRVAARSAFSAKDSEPDDRLFVFRYTITITNEGVVPARLLNRHWVIIDANGKREDVRGPGVVGQTPRLEPGQSFQYQSFCPLRTRWGTMEGSYQMERDDGDVINVAISRFYLRMD